MRLKELQKIKKCTIKESAEALNMPFSTFNNYLIGVREPDIQTLIKLADYYGVSLDYLCEHNTPNQLNLPKLNNDQILAINMLVRLNAENFKKVFTEISGKFISQTDIAN